MKELNEEIKQTINLIQSDIRAGLRDEMQKHLNGLLEIKRNELAAIQTDQRVAKAIIDRYSKPQISENKL